MTPISMTLPHQTDPWAWPVAGVMPLPAAAQRRWLAVQEGRVWLTRSRRDATEPDMADDIWLEAGQRHALPAGSAWVIEAWPQAQVALLQAPPRPAAAAGLWRPAWRKGWLRWPGQPQVCGA
jgi:Protein of unknown function (DUF2917)